MTAPGYQMTLAALLPEQRQRLVAAGMDGLAFTGLSLDSRRVLPGDLFLACRGERFNGADFIDAAVARGAAAVLVDQQVTVDGCPVPVITVSQLTQRLAELGSRFYAEPSRQMHLVGITGTNGKTSISHFIASALDLLGSRAAVIGTNGYGFLEALNSASHTTPDALSLQRLLAQLRDQGAKNVIMEVSSHALDQQRVAKVNFAQAVFTNLTRDHLDYHGDMGSYGAAKQRLFTDYGVRQAIINLDDPYARQLLDGMPAAVEVIGFGLQPSPLTEQYRIKQLWVTQQQLSTEGIEATLATPRGALSFKSRVLGQFNLYNLMATAAVLQGLGFDSAQLAAVMAQLQGVTGRMQPIHASDGRLVVIDYAHTPDALEKALAALKQHCRGRLWCVFGCGGDRDRGKRPQMAAVAERLADQSVVTSDNPRSEDPAQIIDQVLEGFGAAAAVQVQTDRRTAIAAALAQAQPGDVVLVAGKGHEDYQEIDAVRHPFDDAEVVRALLAGETAEELADD